MNLTDNLLSESWYWGAWLVWLLVSGHVVRRAPWSRLADAELFNVWLGMIVLLTLLWSLQAGIKPGLSLHLLGATVFTLSFGPYLAFVGLSLVMAGVSLNGEAGIFAFGANVLLTAGVGVLFSHLLYRFLSSLLPRHFFVYVFVNGFVGSALTILAVGLVSTCCLVVADAYSWEYLSSEYLPYFLLLAFSEAWLSGMVLTLFVVYRPSWVMTFDDSRYLNGK